MQTPSILITPSAGSWSLASLSVIGEGSVPGGRWRGEEGGGVEGVAGRCRGLRHGVVGDADAVEPDHAVGRVLVVGVVVGDRRGVSTGIRLIAGEDVGGDGEGGAAQELAGVGINLVDGEVTEGVAEGDGAGLLGLGDDALLGARRVQGGAGRGR